MNENIKIKRCVNCGKELPIDSSELCDECATKPVPTDILDEEISPAVFTAFAVPDSATSPEDYSEVGLSGLVQSNPTKMCPYFPSLCIKADTHQCTKECEHNPENYMDPHIKEVFDKEPYSNYCFDCGEFVPSRCHEDALEPPEVVYSHTVGTGYEDYRLKLSQWVMRRIGGGI